MTATAILRAAALVVAVAGAIDPAMTTTQRPPLAVDVAVPAAAEAPATPQLVRDLTSAVSDAVRLRVRPYDPDARLPCAADRPCVIVTDGASAPRGGLARRPPLLVIAPSRTAVAGAPRIDDVRVEPVAVDEQATAEVTLSASGAAGGETYLEIYDDEVPVGSRRHTWTEESPVTVTVPWWPARPGHRRLAVTATTTGPAGGAAQRARVDLPVDVSATPWPVLVVEARPSWAATFARRALEADSRLEVDTVAVLAPGVAATRGVNPRRVRAAGVTDAQVARARVVVVGGLDALSAADVARFERFVSTRGGALVLVPDAVVTGPAARLMPGQWRRRLETGPAPATPSPADDPALALRASEWLLASDLGAGDTVLAGHDGTPAVVARAIGEGRVLVVGALDAWRFRLPTLDALADGTAATGRGGTAEPGATPFDRAWQRLVADLARGTAPPVEVRVSHEAGDGDATIDVQGRTLAARASWRAAARVVCGGSDVPLRLWPQARAGHFRGRAPWPPAGTSCDVVATVDGLGEGQAALPPSPTTRAAAGRVTARLGALAAATGGLVAAPGDAGAIAKALAALPRPEPVATPRWPMRSWWWGLAATLALAAEWWRRRAAGAR